MKALVYQVSTPRWIACKLASLVSPRVCFGLLSGLRLQNRPLPERPGPGWVRLRTTLAGVCGTDLALIGLKNHPNTILQQFSRFPAVLGHENVAVIDEIGSEITGWQVGQRVCVEPALGCLGRGTTPPCPACAAGMTSICERKGESLFPPRALLGLNDRTGGSWAEYFVAHESQLHAVPEGVSDETAVLVDPIASAAHAVLRRQPKPGDKVLVYGSGIIALGVIASIRALGLDNAVTAIVRHPFQVDLAKAMGATHVIRQPRNTKRIDRYRAVASDTGGIRQDGRMGNQSLIGGYDLTFHCTGSGAAFTDAMMWTRSRGVVVAVGTTGISMMDSTPIWFDELQVVGANGRQIEDIDGRPRHTYQIVFEWLLSGRLDLSMLPVSRHSLTDYRSALTGLITRTKRPVVKAVFDPHA